MAKTVQLSERAYATLKANKRANESFSDVVMRILAERKDPMKLLDMPPIDADYDLDELKRVSREIDLRRLKERGGP